MVKNRYFTKIWYNINMKNLVITLLILLAPLNKSFSAMKPETYDTMIIGSAIRILNPKIDPAYANTLSSYIRKVAIMFDLDYRLFVLILKVESDFNHKAVSTTGDLSIAQIYHKYWMKPHRRAHLKVTGHLLDNILDHEFYALMVMGEILKLNQKFVQEDLYWFARYHSNTPEFKEKYIKKMKEAYAKIKHLNFNKYHLTIRKNDYN